MDDRTKRNEGQGKAARVADVGTETRKLSAQCSGLLAEQACVRISDFSDVRREWPERGQKCSRSRKI